ncbi:fungal pheromone mating factor STE2 GPCR-domain-containing protein [Xylariales sp. AK1849]|nr:fungal pheromone mating factor STE2 GPCR-domain-containing protein [Xylariales sp. AK1849]
MWSFNPKNQSFLIAGFDGQADISISMPVIDAQRVRLANLCISYGVQLGLSLMMLLALLLLIPVSRMQRPIHMVHIWSLIVAVVRLTLLVQYFSGPLSEYYVAWTRDTKALRRSDYWANTAGNACDVLQFTLIEGALIMQSWGLIETWPDVWRYLLKGASIALAVATVVVKSIWVVHHTWALRDSTLPVALDNVGAAATVLGAVSIFYFCGIFFMNLSVHLTTTRGILARPGRGLTSLEILAIGNGILMVLPSAALFAGLDIAAGLSGTKVLPFDAGSWVMTLVVIGLPLTGLIARYRGPVTLRYPSRRLSHFANGPIHDPKPRRSQADNTTFGSPLAGSFIASAGVTRNGTMNACERVDSADHSDRGDNDLEAGIQVRRSISVTVGRSGGVIRACRASGQDTCRE